MNDNTAPAHNSTHRAVARGMTYELLARSFPYPDAAALAAAREMAELALAAEVPDYVRELANASLDARQPALQGEHAGLFTMVTSPDCPTYESAYVCTDAGQQTSVMADVAGFYRAFGLELGAHVRPDDITAELEFAGFLCRKEAFAIEHLGAARTGQARRAQRIFLRDHLGRWGAALGRDVAARARPGSFYAALGRALAEWIRHERQAFRLADIATVDRPRVPWQVGRFDPAIGPGSAALPPGHPAAEAR